MRYEMLDRVRRIRLIVTGALIINTTIYTLSMFAQSNSIITEEKMNKKAVIKRNLLITAFIFERNQIMARR